MKLSKNVVIYTSLSAIFTLILIVSIMYFFIDKNIFSQLMSLKFSSISLAVILLVGTIVIGMIVGFAMVGNISHVEKELTLNLEQVGKGTFHKTETKSLQKYELHFKELLNGISKQVEDSKKTVQKLVDEKKALENQQIEDVITKERHRLARELHDSVSQQLFAISMMISAINEVGDTTFKDQLQYIEKMAVNAQSEMRALLLHLRPAQLEGKSLKEGVEKLLADLNGKQSLQLSWTVDEISLSHGVEDHIFRIIQEVLSNTLRHAEANKFELRIRKIEDFVLVRMIDDGKGFDLEKRKNGSYGIQSIIERAKEIGGNAKIISVPDRGTQIEVKVPLVD
ncbi:sensor histidine kinase [Bacillus sp. RG28]|uniref:Sensor histidine kinase n=1 Tax=Gottfriedia endophytica TaxID=2820819 RepID=A0A940NPD9_9BACI|nr:sensor histidine kinase [Gottfriedia endophytica]MBP0725879.1 sensor histidine kinase [Gottfriedia endophytica]